MLQISFDRWRESLRELQSYSVVELRLNSLSDWSPPLSFSSWAHRYTALASLPTPLGSVAGFRPAGWNRRDACLVQNNTPCAVLYSLPLLAGSPEAGVRKRRELESLNDIMKPCSNLVGHRMMELKSIIVLTH